MKREISQFGKIMTDITHKITCKTYNIKNMLHIQVYKYIIKIGAYRDVYNNKYLSKITGLNKCFKFPHEERQKEGKTNQTQSNQKKGNNKEQESQ